MTAINKKTFTLIFVMILLIGGGHGISSAQNNVPVFSDGASATREIAENSPPGTNIGDPITAQSADNSTVTYSLVAHEDEPTDYLSFAIDTATGQLSTGQSLTLNYENQASDNEYLVKVTASSDDGSTTIPVTINVTDVPIKILDKDGNEISAATRTVTEDTAGGVNIGDPFRLQDGDPSSFDHLEFHQSGYFDDHALFDFVESTDENGNKIWYVQTKEPLDFENKRTHKFRIIAGTRPSTVQADQIVVTVNVENVNEAPEFTDGAAGSRDILESQPAGTPIGEPVAATDPDITTANPTDVNPDTPAVDSLAYTLSGDDATSFTIDATGQLKTTFPLDYEDPQNPDHTYNVIVTVTDSEFSVDIPVTITVLDIVVAFVEGDATTRTIAENTAPGSNIGAPVATPGPDIGYTLTYTLSGTEDAPDDYKSFDINERTGQLLVKDPLNYEVKTAYEVMVSVTDNSPAFEIDDTITVTINVTDQSETATPTFRDGNSTTRTIAENTATGTRIGLPIDAINLGQYYEYRRAASNVADFGTIRDRFSINRGTGQLTSRVEFNHEDRASYSLEVTLFLGGINRAQDNPETVVYDDDPTDTITVTVNIENVNEAPMFADQFTVRSIAEDTAANQNIGAAITAADPDITTTNPDTNPETTADDTLTYILGGDDADTFNIDSTTGQLTTKAGVTLNHETMYSVVVTASDGALTDASTLTDSIDVTIDVTEGTDIVPTVLIVPPDTVQTGNFDVPIRFSVPVDGFAATDITLTVTLTAGSGSPTPPTLVDANDGDMDYTARISPPDNAEGALVISVPADAVTKTSDASIGNLASDEYTVEFDTKHPTVTIADPPSPVTGSFSVLITFSEDVGDTFTAGDFNPRHITVAVTKISPTEYIATFTPTASGTFSFLVRSNSVRDAAGNGNDQSNAEATTVTLGAPTVTIAAPTTTQTGVFDVTITFSENVTGFEVGDITLGGTGMATVSSLTGSGTTYTAMITPTIGGDIEISVPADSAEDTEGNGNTASPTTVTVTVTLGGPTVTITGVPTAPTNSAFTVTFTFSEEIAGFAADDISLGDGVSATVNNFMTISAADGTYEADIQPAPNVDEVITLYIPAGSLSNGAMVDNVDSAKHTVRLDTLSPGVSIMGPTEAQSGAFEVTITFTEEVTDFDMGDISLTDSTATATITDFTAVSSAKYTAQITPTTQGDVVIQVPAAAAQDTATNTSTASNPLTVGVDFNEAPVFDAGDGPITRAIAENTATGTNIGTPVAATDPDITTADDANPETPERETLTYLLGGRDVAVFDINSETGQLLTKDSLDFETQDTYSVIITVSDGALIDTIGVTITITDVDETVLNNAPTFTDGTTTTRSVAENTAAGTNIGTPVAATDTDTDDTLTYSLSGTDAASFDIVTTSGQLQTKAALDFETEDEYVVTVRVTDGTDTDSIDVTITITNVNEAPTFPTTETGNRSIAENTAANTNIGTAVVATDPDVTATNTDVDPSDATVDALTYSLVNLSGSMDAEAFDIESTSGQIKTKDALDYETKTSYAFKVRASDGEFNVDIQVTVTITDVDETVPNNAPTFTDGDSTTRSVAENTVAGTNIGTAVGATDTDTDDTLTYSLSGTDAASFDIVTTSGQLQTKAALDFETEDEYSVMVEVTDGTDTDSIDVTINVTNVNEAPTFATTTTTRSIAENTAANTNIGTAVGATDPDGTTDVNPTDANVFALTYTLVNLSGSMDADAFAIESTSGQIKTKDALDYETKDSYVFKVRASDGEFSDDIEVTVTITDVDETVPNNAPTFTDGDSTTRSVAENTAAGTNIGTAVGATDTDTDDTLTYTLGGTDGASFDIDSSTGQLQTNAALDFETKNEYFVTVTVSDGTDTDSITVTINITNVNEAPSFPSDPTSFSISESATVVGSVVATDPDAGDTLTYTLEGTDAASFSINNSGQLTLKTGVTLTAGIYTVTVKASDGSLSDTIDLTITVTGAPVPTGDRPDILMYVMQDDEVKHDQTVTGPFALIMDFNQAVTGFDQSELQMRGADVTISGWGVSANRERYTATVTPQESGSLTFEVPANAAQAEDDGQGNVRTKLYVKVNLAEEDDNPEPNSPPVFSDGPNTTRSIPEGIAANRAIGAPVAAVDPNGDTLSYSLSGTDASSFSITRSNGQLRTRATLDYETKKKYTVTVEVSDGRGGTATITVTINVTDVEGNADENPPNRLPVFTDGDKTTRSIAENKAAGSNIGQPVAATDPDGGTLTYSILKGTDSASFSITASNGQLKTKAALDHETKSQYTVKLEVSDGDGGTDIITVTINVTDVDETGSNRPPAFASDSTNRSIVEGETANRPIGARVAATDPDEDTLTYSLSGTDAASFNVDTSNGQLKTNAALNNETKSQYGVTVEVSDRNGGTDTITVTITVLSSTTKLDRPEALVYAMQNGVEAIAQTVIVGTFSLVMDFDEPVTDFTRSELKFNDDNTGATITGWSGSDGDKTYTATVTTKNVGGVTFEVPANAARAKDDGQGNVQTKLSVFVEAPNPAAPNSAPPNETTLLPNYPNPSNPETWIPYQLSKPANVTLAIYNMRGVVVRQFALGHQAAGMYRSRSHAIHWDGKNEQGESAASGVYFYQLKAGKYTATRKMLIRK